MENRKLRSGGGTAKKESPISTWVEIRIRDPVDVLDVHEDEFKMFVRRHGNIAALAEKKAGDGIKPHVTLLWCGKGTTTEDVMPVAKSLVEELDIAELHTITGSIEPIGRACIALKLNTPPGTLAGVQTFAEALYKRLEHKPGMVNPAERPINPHITLFDFGSNTNARDLAMAQLRDVQEQGNGVMAFANRRVIFKPVYYVLTKDASKKRTVSTPLITASE